MPNETIIDLPITSGMAQFMITFRAWFDIVKTLMSTQRETLGPFKPFYELFNSYADLKTIMKQDSLPTAAAPFSDALFSTSASVSSSASSATSSRFDSSSSGASSSSAPAMPVSAKAAESLTMLEPIPHLPWQVGGFLRKLYALFVDLHRSTQVKAQAEMIISLNPVTHATIWPFFFRLYKCLVREAGKRKGINGLLIDDERREDVTMLIMEMLAEVYNLVKKPEVTNNPSILASAKKSLKIYQKMLHAQAWIEQSAAKFEELDKIRYVFLRIHKHVPKMEIQHPHLFRYLLGSLLNSTVQFFGEVNINNIDADEYVCLNKIISFAEILRSNETLTHLSINKYQINAEGTKFLAQGLKSNKTLTGLNLAGNTIEPEGVQCLIDMLSINSTLTSLDVGDSGESVDMSALAAVVADHPSISEFGLLGSCIGFEGVKTLLQSPRLTLLAIAIHLSFPDANADDLKVIASAVENNTSLTRLNINNNDEDDDADFMYAILDGLRANTTLRTLDLEGSICRSEGGHKIAQLLQVNTSITALDIDDCWFTDPKESEAISRALATNGTLTELDVVDYLKCPEKDKFKELLERNNHNQAQQKVTLFGALFTPVFEHIDRPSQSSAVFSRRVSAAGA